MGTAGHINLWFSETWEPLNGNRVKKDWRIRRLGSWLLHAKNLETLIYSIKSSFCISFMPLHNLALSLSLSLCFFRLFCLAFSHFSNEKIVSMKFPTIFPLRTAVENEFSSKRLPAVAGKKKKKLSMLGGCKLKWKTPFFPLPPIHCTTPPSIYPTPIFDAPLCRPLCRQKMHSHSCVKTFPLFPREMQAAGKEEL